MSDLRPAKSGTAIILEREETHDRDPDLWHKARSSDPTRTLCGEAIVDPEALPAGEAGRRGGAYCVVCLDLARAWREGRWKP